MARAPILILAIVDGPEWAEESEPARRVESRRAADDMGEEELESERVLLRWFSAEETRPECL